MHIFFNMFMSSTEDVLKETLGLYSFFIACIECFFDIANSVDVFKATVPVSSLILTQTTQTR